MTPKELIDIFSALLTPVIAIILVYIAYQQYQTNRVRLKHELYERRVAVFRGVLSHLSAVLRWTRVKDEDLVELIKTSSEKEFLFDKDVCEYIEGVYQKSVKLWYTGNQLHDRPDPIPPSEERTALARENSELIKWMTDQIPELRNKFSKYLRLTE